MGILVGIAVFVPLGRDETLLGSCRVDGFFRTPSVASVNTPVVLRAGCPIDEKNGYQGNGVKTDGLAEVSESVLAG